MILSPVQNCYQLDQGHIIDGLANPSFSSQTLCVTLNPTCLFENSKVHHIIVAYLIPVEIMLRENKEWLSFVGSLEDGVRNGIDVLSKKKGEKVEKILGDTIDNDEPRRYFFLGALPEIELPEVLIDFQQIASFPINRIEPYIKIIAKVNSPFREKMITSYAGYMMRVGTARYEGEERKTILSKLIAPMRMPQDTL